MARQRTFVADLASVAAARRWVQAQLERLPHADVVLLLVSELATNAVIHAQTDFDVGVECQGPDHVIIHVRDRNDELPEIRPIDPGQTSGRGLMMVAAITDDWGVTPLEVGKDIWFCASVSSGQQ